MSFDQHERGAFEAIVECLCRDDPQLPIRAHREWIRRVRRQRAGVALFCATGFFVLVITTTGALAALTADGLAVAGLVVSYEATSPQPVPVQARLRRARIWLRNAMTRSA